MEITLLAGIGADGGVRYAISALVQYAVIAIGFLAAFEAIGMDWSKFGWMAAALGVGLGFGLQEIVANFVSGIILLFERPIRVGDVVTIGETTGVVSRIRIRATTITDWDRKEYVVPNKEFITGRLLNWTLSNKVNRLVIKVGVSYGADAERVRDLLLGIVNGHPAILEDPAPGVTFDNFGDSSLDFTIRCFLPDLDRRLATTHELHSQIHERFAKEGIEIPFPQRDLHVRSGWGG
ncbi:MAG: mechanosensitive ion channel [Verrucomicrobia bacterium]|nr:mechanosensitive ion channel [Verrucomicrobiota bacterium]